MAIQVGGEHKMSIDIAMRIQEIIDARNNGLLPIKTAQGLARQYFRDRGFILPTYNSDKNFPNLVKGKPTESEEDQSGEGL